MKESAEIRVWLIRCVAEQLSQVLETMAGETPLIESTPRADLLPDAAALQFWEIGLSVAPGAKLTLAATPASSRALGGRILTAAGLELDDEETIRSTFQETIDQALSGVAQNATSQLGREVTATPSKNMAYAASPGDDWASITLAFEGGDSVELFLLWNGKLLEGFREEPEAPAKGATSLPAAPSSFQAVAVIPERKNSDLLYDVELPVCVSFGRAHLQLRDVMKLTTGSIVELNRTVSEPVEIIVNNCVIARGEVVVVEGNFGVRINEVVSRQERLRTLH
jgi:flagellar motor switch protein FliN/FliY